MTCLPKQHLSLLLCFYISLQTLKGPLYSLWTNVSNEMPVKTAKSLHTVPNRKTKITSTACSSKHISYRKDLSHPFGVFESKTESLANTFHLLLFGVGVFIMFSQYAIQISAHFCNKVKLVFTWHLHMSFDFQ